jgi:DNA-binding transcriptional LysR family regulator
LLAYGQDSFLGRLSTYAARVSNIDLVPSHVNDNAVAEILKAMVLAGHGVAWLPESLIRRDLANAQLHDLGADVPMEIRMYRSAKKSRKAVVKVWETAMALRSTGGR